MDQDQNPSVGPQGSNKSLVISLFAVIIVLVAVVAYLFFVRKANAPEVTDTTRTQEQMQNAENQNNPSAQEKAATDWKTYTNTQYSFELQYPNGVEVGNKVQSINLGTAQNPVYGTGVGGAALVALDKPELKAQATSIMNQMESYVNSPKGPNNGEMPDPVCTKQNITDKRVNGIYCVGEGGPAYYVYISGAYMDFFYDGYATKTIDNDTANKIFSTFKFTNQDEVANRKTYTNQKYNLQFQYPSNWKVSEDSGSNLISVYGPNADLASIGIKFYASLADLPINPSTHKPYENFEQYVMDSHWFENQKLIEWGSGTAYSANLPQGLSYKVLLIGGNTHFYQISYMARYNQTASQLDQIVSTFKFTN